MTLEEIEFKAKRQTDLDAKQFIESLTLDARIGGHAVYYESVVRMEFVAGGKESFGVAVRKAFEEACKHHVSTCNGTMWV